MAGGMDLGSGGKGGKKPLDTAINLVPFIDLMAVTISFLIMTAVWTQIGRLQVSQSGNENTQEEKEPPKTLQVSILITDKALKLTVGGAAQDLPLTRSPEGKLDLTKLSEKLKEVKAQSPETENITLQTEDAVKYDDLVTIIDTCIGPGRKLFPSVSVSPAMG